MVLKIGYSQLGGLTIILLLHGVEPSVLKQKILDGKSITIVDKECKFYSSVIVTDTLPISLGVRPTLKQK